MGPGGPGPLNGRARIFFVKIEGLLEPVVLNLSFRVRLTLCLHPKDDISVTDILKILKNNLKLFALFLQNCSKNLKAFTVSLAFNDPQQLSLAPGLPPAKSGRACYDNPTGRGYFYQMSNMYTCIAYLTENRKFCSKTLVHKGVNFEAPNALKLTYEHL